MHPQEKTRLLELRSKIDKIETLVGELYELGHHIPTVEKNARILLNTTSVLKFGISDIADIDAA